MPLFFKGDFKMVCNCKCADDTTIKFIRGTSAYLRFVFNVSDLSSFAGVNLTIRKDYNITPVIDKTISDLSGNYVLIALTPDETALFNEFLNGKNSASYIWGLDLLVNENERINVFPKTGNAAPLCIVYKHVDVE